MSEKLQKIISARGVTSRRRAEEMILAGRVTCNGRISQLGNRADPESDIICIDSVPLPPPSGKVYLMLHKPRGYVTTLSDEKGRKDAAQLVADCDVRVYPVGRLDMDSEGLLLFTNDGDFANYLMHPKHQVEKTYRVIVGGYSDAAFEKLKQPIVLDGYRIRPPKATCLRKSDVNAELLVTIHEGRNRQVRRMCDAAGMSVRRLIRIAEGTLQLGDLPCGKWRYLTEEEIAALSQ